jgi:hypothetical protein
MPPNYALPLLYFRDDLSEYLKNFAKALGGTALTRKGVARCCGKKKWPPAC